MSMFGLYTNSQIQPMHAKRSAGAGSIQRQSLKNKNRSVMMNYAKQKKAEFLIQGVNKKERMGNYFPEQKSNHSQQYDAALPRLRQAANSVDPNLKKMQMRYLESIKKSEYELPKALQKYGPSLEKRQELENKRYLNNKSQ